MAFSDDEETVPEFVTDYYFLDDDGSAISFTDLPIQFDIAEEMDATNRKAFLRGIGEGAVVKVYIQVIAWKLLLEDDQPQAMVLTKKDRWISLKKPRKCYGNMIRTILIIFQFFHFLKKNPRESVKSLRDHLCQVFGCVVSHFVFCFLSFAIAAQISKVLESCFYHAGHLRSSILRKTLGNIFP